MPKKFKGTNTKSEEARARKEAVRVAEKERKQKEEEDKFWEDNDKHVVRKQHRKVCHLLCFFYASKKWNFFSRAGGIALAETLYMY